MRKDRGFALLLVLWAMVLLSMIGTHIASSGRAEAQLAGNVRSAAVAEAAAEGAVQEAAFHLLAAPEQRWPADGTPRRVELPGAGAVVRIQDEGGKVNPNLASPELLAALLRGAGADAGAARSIAAAIVDWRYPTNQARPGGAKLPEYRAAGLGYGPSGAPMRGLDELGAVLGMTPALLARIAPDLSFYALNEPEPALASPAVREAIRAATGRFQAAGGTRGPPAVVLVTVTADGPDGARASKQAVVQLLRGGNGQPPGARVLALGTP